MTTRRLFLAGAASLIAAPAIVRTSSIMRVVMPKPELIRQPAIVMPNWWTYWDELAKQPDFRTVYIDPKLAEYFRQGLTSPNRKWFTLEHEPMISIASQEALELLRETA